MEGEPSENIMTILDATHQAESEAWINAPNGGEIWLQTFNKAAKRLGLIYDPTAPCHCHGEPDGAVWGHHHACGLILETSQ